MKKHSNFGCRRCTTGFRF